MANPVTRVSITVAIGSEQEEAARNALKTLRPDVGPAEVWRGNVSGQNITFSTHLDGDADAVRARLTEISDLPFNVEDDSDSSTD